VVRRRGLGADRLGPILHGQIARQHGPQFEEIVQESPALQRSVEQLEREDGEVAAAYESLRAKVAKLTAKAAKVEPDEALMSQEAARFADEGVWFVVRVRKQDAAIRTWLGEALNRETPASD
jgi:hypothetical protein